MRHMCMLLLVGWLVAPPLGAAQETQDPGAIPASLVEAIGRLTARIGSDTTVTVAYCLSPPGVIGVFVHQSAANAAIGARSGCRSIRVRTPAQSDRVLTTSLMRRIVEAADGYRTGDTLWVVAAEEFPHNVRGVHWSLEDALENQGPGDVVEPVWSQADDGLDRVVVPMEHLPDSECTFDDPDCCDKYLNRVCPWVIDDLVRLEDVDSTVIQFYRDSTLALRVRYGPDSPDALFLTVSAIDKFYVPYLTRAYGVDYAAAFRANYVGLVRQLRGR